MREIYVDALSQLGINLTFETKSSGSIRGHVKAKASYGEGLLAQVLGVKTGIETGVDGEKSNEEKSSPVGQDIENLRFIAEIIKRSGRRLVVEDFHYLAIPERKAFSHDLKTLWDYGVFVVVIGVWNQNNMLIYLNRDLSGRIEERSIYWSKEDLKKVLIHGGEALNLAFSDSIANKLCGICYGNVGILQAISLKLLDAANVYETCNPKLLLSNESFLETAALQYAEQLNALYQLFAKTVSDGIRKRKDTTGIYAHTMWVITEASDEELMKSLSADLIYTRAHSREPRIQKGNLKQILEKFEDLQVDSDGKGLVLSYNEVREEISVVDRQLFFYRKYCTVNWPWESLLLEQQAE